jgi:hypothetical protein
MTVASQWDEGKGSHHPDYNPQAKGTNVMKASRETEELLQAIIKVRATTKPNRLPPGEPSTDRPSSPPADHRLTHPLHAKHTERRQAHL